MPSYLGMIKKNWIQIFLFGPYIRMPVIPLKTLFVFFCLAGAPACLNIYCLWIELFSKDSAHFFKKKKKSKFQS